MKISGVNCCLGKRTKSQSLEDCDSGNTCCTFHTQNSGLIFTGTQVQFLLENLVEKAVEYGKESRGK